MKINKNKDKHAARRMNKCVGGETVSAYIFLSLYK